MFKPHPLSDDEKVVFDVLVKLYKQVVLRVVFGTDADWIPCVEHLAVLLENISRNLKKQFPAHDLMKACFDAKLSNAEIIIFLNYIFEIPISSLTYTSAVLNNFNNINYSYDQIINLNNTDDVLKYFTVKYVAE